ncbi:MAG: phospholipid carrier-dependent glycosyltransferase, partial [Gemmatimonadetes bacterium]|nr:phospholipid carrier-dependent glycosyltransferase [Gemmatimonadota bacterium]
MANPIRSAFDGCGALLPGETTARRVTLAILLLAVLLRALLVIANVQANDDHLGVIRIIAHEHRFPEPHEDREAFQPKLYHTTVAAVLQILPALPMQIEYRVAQAVSAAAGIATLLVLLAFLKRFELSERARLWTFGLVALNPKMISTSIQATNDAFVILFASAAIFAAWRFFSSGTTASLAATTGFAILAAISKGNGLVLAIAVVCLFLGLLAHPDERLGLSR